MNHSEHVKRLLGDKADPDYYTAAPEPRSVMRSSLGWAAETTDEEDVEDIRHQRKMNRMWEN